MKLILPLFVLLPLAAWAAQPPAPPRAAEPPPKEVEEERPAEPLPEYPKADPKSTVTPLTPDKKLLLDVPPAGQGRRVGLACEVCRRDGQLEVFLCKRGTKEHEAVVRTEVDAQLVHAGLMAAGAKPGQPVQFVNPKTEEPEFKPATGSKIKVSVHYKMGGKLHTHPAQEWVWNTAKKKPLEANWLFAGSMLLKNPDRPDDKPYYAANSGDVIGISNFPYAMLDVDAQIGMDDANLNYEPKTARIPPLLSKVWVILEPVAEKKEPEKK